MSQRSSLLVLLAALAAPGLLSACPQAPVAEQAATVELFDVVRVVDGDTIHIQRRGKKEKLRLLSVDTEEKITGRPASSSSKPETVYGQETAQWAIEFFAALGKDGAHPRVSLRFPGNQERYDVYGRLLCHVVLEDGRDFNLLLVQEGKSPYFNKYGNSRICHREFVEAQKAARSAKLGIWNPKTNRSSKPGAPAAVRPYDKLMPWWQARAEAIDAFRRDAATNPGQLASSDAPDELEALRLWCAEEDGREGTVFGSIDRFFEEKDGSLTVLFRSGDRRNAFRAFVPRKDRAALASAIDLEATKDEFRQNYLRVTGKLVRGERGFRMEAGAPGAWKVAGPQPKVPSKSSR